MAKQFLGLRTVIYRVNDLKKATDWYSKAVGKEPYFNQPFYVGFNVGGYELGLQPIESDDFVQGNNEVVYWGVDDIKDTFDRLIELGASSHKSPQNVGGDIMVASLKDPWGNILGIIYNPEFEIE